MSHIFLPPPPANLLAGVMHPLPDLEYRVGLVSLDVSLRARVTGFLPFRCVVLALFIRHLVRMYRPWFVPVLHSLPALFKDHDEHRHKGRHAYDGVNDEAQPYRSFRHPVTSIASASRLSAPNNLLHTSGSGSGVVHHSSASFLSIAFR